MKYRDIMLYEASDHAAVTATPFNHIDPIFNKPMVSFRIYVDGKEVGTVYGQRASTPEQAVQYYLDHERWLAQQPPPSPPSVQPKKRRRIREPRADVRVWIVPSNMRRAITSNDEPDDYLYHVTSWPRARLIIRQGLRINRSPMFTNYGRHSGGRVFVTERGGVGFWEEKVEQHLHHNYDAPPPVAVLRLRRADVAALLRPDPVGTKDAGAPAYYIETNYA